MCPTNNVNTLLHSVARLCKQVVSCVQWQTLSRTLPNPTGEGSGHAGRNCWHDGLLAEFV